MKDKIINIKNLTKVFEPPFYALKNINLSVKRGEIFGIIGMSGAGKSTLIRCLTSLEQPTNGSLTVLGKEFSALTKKQLRETRKKMGMIFQHFNLLSSRNALENVAFPLEIENITFDTRSQRALQLLDFVGLKGKEGLYPPQLSGGQQQRVGIARALANQPEILLCDEATSALDPHSTQAILDLLLGLNQTLGLTLVMITHEMEVIKKICTHVAVLEEGEIVEQGEVADLFAAPKHPTTQRFLQNLVHEVPSLMLPKSKDKELLRLCFRGKSASQPLISRLIREYKVEVNILLGAIDQLRSETIGNLVVELSGSEEEREKARHFLIEHHVSCEEIAS
ncbi:MAG: ATP-binding cassette domain-containing protein [Chlamydiales bacterium]